MKQFFLIYISIFFVADIYAQDIKSFWPNGNHKEKGHLKSGLKDGKFQEFYENGKVKSQGKYKKGDYGLYNGELNGFYENGKKWFHIVYNSKERTELAEEWDSNGKQTNTITVQYL